MSTTAVTDDRSAELEAYRRELTGYCYRMLGSAFDAEDAVQETLTRAWRNLDRFEGRSSLRTWLYRIASRVCFDATDAGRRRARPLDLGPAGSVEAPDLAQLPERAWVGPVPGGAVVAEGDPAVVVEARESVRLAFVAALQHLPPRQRAVLMLREVLHWSAAEVAELLETSVASVNSALQRARATLAEQDLDAARARPLSHDDVDLALLDRYVAAFERYDMDALAALLAEDVVQSMPPFRLWLSGRDAVLGWMLGPGAECRDSRLVRIDVNGSPGYAQYRDGGATPWSINVLHVADGKVAEIANFIETDGSLFRLFGLPPTLV